LGKKRVGVVSLHTSGGRKERKEEEVDECRLIPDSKRKSDGIDHPAGKEGKKDVETLTILYKLIEGRGRERKRPGNVIPRFLGKGER